MTRNIRHPLPRRDTLFKALAVILTTHAIALPALAQDPAPAAGSDELDRIVVTAQKREQQIEDVPISISAYSGDFLQEQGINDYGDLGTLVPGLEVQTQSVSNPSISIRGITADLDDPTQEPRISLYQDGVSISRSRGSSVEMFDLQRVEILRGPQGTLFGRAAEIGALHLIQNKARKGREGGFELGLGSDAQRRFTGFYNTDLGDNVQGRVAAFYETRDGYIDNLDGGTLQGKDTRAIRGALHFDIGENGNIDVILNYQKDTPPGTGFRSQVIPNTRGSLDPFTANSQRGDALGTDREVYGATMLGDFRISENWSVSTITGWRRHDGLDKFDSDGSQADLIEFDEHAWGNQFSQEVRFNFDAGGKFTGFVGASYFDENANRDLDYQTDERQLYALLSPTINGNLTALIGATGANYYFPIIPLLNPNLTPNASQASTWLPSLVPIVTPTPTNPAGFLALPLNPDHRETFGNDVDIRAFELFADGTWQFSDAWSLTLGLRGSHESVEYGYFAAPGNGSALGYLLSARGTPACTPPTPCTNLLFPATAGRLSGSGSYTSWVGRAVLGYRIGDNINTYASVSRGRRPAMINVSDLGEDEVAPEIVWSYELGMKGSNGDGRFVYDLSLFYYDYNNFQASVKNATPPPFFVTKNAGKAHALGFEASLFGRFTDNVNGWFNYAYIDGGFNALDDNGDYQELAGNEFRMTPKQSLSVGLDWTIPLSSGSLYIRPSYSWRSHVYFEDENQPGIEQDGYGLVNLRAGWRFNDNWEVGVWGNNLTNEKYLTDAGNTGLLFGIPTVIPGPDRMYGVSLKAKF